MNQTLRSFAAGVTGGLLVAALVVAQPALATQLDKTAAKNSVTSKSIKNGTIQAKDLNADLNASLAKANSALQSVADGSITTGKLAGGALAGYSVAQTGSQDLTTSTAFTTVISKALPAGTFMVSAKAILSADYTDNTQGASEQCRLTNGTLTDVSQVAGGMGTIFLFHRNVGTVNMALPVTGPATVSLQCKNDLNAPPAGYALGVSQGRITAVQTTSNN
jgi:hypothetical protein